SPSSASESASALGSSSPTRSGLCTSRTSSCSESPGTTCSSSSASPPSRRSQAPLNPPCGRRAFLRPRPCGTSSEQTRKGNSGLEMSGENADPGQSEPVFSVLCRGNIYQENREFD